MNGRMALPMKVISLRTNYKASEPKPGLMAPNTQDITGIISFMGRGAIRGKKGSLIRGCIRMGRNMGMGSLRIKE